MCATKFSFCRRLRPSVGLCVAVSGYLHYHRRHYHGDCLVRNDPSITIPFACCLAACHLYDHRACQTLAAQTSEVAAETFVLARFAGHWRAGARSDRETRKAGTKVRTQWPCPLVGLVIERQREVTNQGKQ